MDARAAQGFLPRSGASAQAGAFSWADSTGLRSAGQPGAAVPTWFVLVLAGMWTDDR